MKMLPKKVRLKVYITALAYIETYEGFYVNGLCYALQEALIKLQISSYPNPYHAMEKYPEIYAQKPSDAKGYWWHSRDKTTWIRFRVNALEVAIENAKPRKRKTKKS